MRMVLGIGIAAAVLLVSSAAIALADPNVPNIPAHRHFVQTANGNLVQVGPRLCDDASLQQAFNEFHINVHASATSPTTPIDTLGPQHGAPGLHNLQGAELVIRPCSFAP
jgi:hypothetical protein